MAKSKTTTGKATTAKTFVVEKGIPYNGTTSLTDSSKYPFAKMKVGDSFAFPRDPKMTGRISAAACQQRKKTGKIFSIRRDPKNPKLNRVWLLKVETVKRNTTTAKK